MTETTSAPGPTAPSSTGSRAAWVTALAAFVVFLPSLSGTYLYDDLQLVLQNPLAHELGHVGACFTSYFWDVPDTTHAQSLHYYRPLICASYALNWVAADGAAWSFHLVNVIGHAIATLLATRLALRWAPHPAWAVAAGLVFALHPSRTENVVWISGRTDVLMALFGFLAVELTYLADRPGPRRIAAGAGAIVSITIAILCKEPGVVFALLCYLEATRRGGRWPGSRATRVAVWGSTAVAVGYLLARVWFPVGGHTLRLTPLHGLFTAGAYVERLLLPWPQTVCYRPISELDGSVMFPLQPLGIGVATYVGLLALLVLAARRGLRTWLLLAAPLVFMAPLSNLVPTGLSYSTADRFLYVPAFLLVLALAALWPDGAARVAARRALRLAGLGVATIWGAICLLRCGDFTSQEAFWGHELALAPENPQVKQEVARLSARAGDVDEAARLLESYLSDPRRYPLLEKPSSRATAYARLLGLEAARTADGDVEKLSGLLSELRAYLELRPEGVRGVAAGGALEPLPTRAVLEDALGRNRTLLHSEAAFVASRVASQETTRELLAGVDEARLSLVWNLGNLILAHARAFDLEAARRVLSEARRSLPDAVAGDLERRLSVTEQWLARADADPSRAPLARALALAELGAYVRALRELRPLHQQQKEPNEIVRLYVELLVSARLDAEARREARAFWGAEQGDAFVEATLRRISPRVRSLPAAASETWWAAP